jgi:hypothetical protein
VSKTAARRLSCIVSLLKPKVCVLLAAGLLAASAAQARELHWKSLDVDARLDADGVLHVRERQHMVMTGDWNGGERVFRLEPGQEIVLHGMTRANGGSGPTVAMKEGSLEEVDRYAWVSGNTLRWRSRLASDAAFAGQELVYDLDYSVHGVVRRTDAGFALDHDFAFADRVGVIEDHTLTLRVDPAWRVDGPQERTIHAGRLLPGVGHVVHLRMTYVGAGQPSLGASPRQARLLLALTAVPLLLLIQLVASEWIRGRFAPLAPGQAAETSCWSGTCCATRRRWWALSGTAAWERTRWPPWWRGWPRSGRSRRASTERTSCT